MGEKKTLKTKNTSLNSNKKLENFKNKPSTTTDSKSKLTKKDSAKKKFKKRMQSNIKNNTILQETSKDNFNLQTTNSNDSFNLQENINKDNLNLQKTTNEANLVLQAKPKKDNINLQDTINSNDINLQETTVKNIIEKTQEKLEDFQDISLEDEKEKTSKEKTKAKSRLKLKTEEKTNPIKSIGNTSDTYSKVEFETDLKNLKLDAKKFGLEFDKMSVEKKIRKNYKLQFREKTEIINESGNIEIVNKLKPRIKATGFKYKDGLIRRTFYRASDFTRGKIHTEINKTEDDNTTVKALHTSEQFIERNTVNFVRNTNNRRILKHNRIENKISKIENKQLLNNLKITIKDDKNKLKQVRKNQQKRKIYKKMMTNKINKVKFTRRVQNTVSNILSFKSSPLTYIFSFKGILILFLLFIIMMIFSIFIAVFSSNQGIGNIYEIQKAEIYYRELEANVEYNSGIRLDHDPIDLASFLVTLFGEFEFDEEMENFLKEDVFPKHQQGKSLEQIISDFLPLSDYENYLYLYDVKCNFIKYGSPFAFEYEPYISSYVGYRINPTSTNTVLQLHKGLDIAVAGGTEIVAISDGVVTRANYSESYGNIVEILHDDGWISKYAHQERLNVTQGQRVSQGDVIGYVGTTGDSTGNHLHLELYDELGEFMNPIYFIARDNERNDDDN